MEANDKTQLEQFAQALQWQTQDQYLYGNVNGYLFTLYFAEEYLDLYIHLPLLKKEQQKAIHMYLRSVAPEWQIEKHFYKNSSYIISFFSPLPPDGKSYVNVDESMPITPEIFEGYLTQLTSFLAENHMAGDVCVFCGNSGAEENLIANHCYAAAHADCTDMIQERLEAVLPKLPLGKNLLGILGSFLGTLLGIGLFVALSYYFDIIAGGAGYIAGWLSYLFYRWFAGAYGKQTKPVSLIFTILGAFIAAGGALLVHYLMQPLDTGIVTFLQKDTSVYRVGLNFILYLSFGLYGSLSSIAPKLSKSVSMRRLTEKEPTPAQPVSEAPETVPETDTQE